MAATEYEVIEAFSHGDDRIEAGDAMPKLKKGELTVAEQLAWLESQGVIRPKPKAPVKKAPAKKTNKRSS